MSGAVWQGQWSRQLRRVGNWQCRRVGNTMEAGEKLEAESGPCELCSLSSYAGSISVSSFLSVYVSGTGTACARHMACSPGRGRPAPFRVPDAPQLSTPAVAHLVYGCGFGRRIRASGAALRNGVPVQVVRLRCCSAALLRTAAAPPPALIFVHCGCAFCDMCGVCPGLLTTLG